MCSFCRNSICYKVTREQKLWQLWIIITVIICWIVGIDAVLVVSDNMTSKEKRKPARMANDEVITYWRSRRMATMERDLVVRAEAFLEELFGGRLSENEKLAIETWLSVQLETERQGWKKKLHMSMQEIERERKVALDVHSTLQGLSSKVDGVVGCLGIRREPSVYRGADADAKVDHMKTLQRDVIDLAHVTERLHRDRARCLEILGEYQDDGEGDDAPLADLLAKHIAQLKNDLWRAEMKAKETQDRLVREVKLLNQTVEMQSSLAQQEKEERDKERGILKTLLLKQQATKQHAPPTVDAVTKVDKGTHVDILQNLKQATRECCIQVDIRPSPSSHESTCDSAVGSDDISQMSVTRVAKGNSDPALTETKHFLTQESEAGTGRRLRNVHTRRFLKRLDPVNVDNKNSIGFLRHQVVTFAEKFEKAKWEMEFYQRQLAWIKTSPRGYPKDRSRKSAIYNMSDVEEDNRRWCMTEGYLGGAKKQMLPPLELLPEDAANGTPRTRQVQSERDCHARSCISMVKCRRCHRLYRPKENHRLGCKFHPKAQKRIEKFDANGRLLRSAFIWECCMQHADAPGCNVGEHVSV